MGNPAIDFPWAATNFAGTDAIIKHGPCVMHNITLNGTTTVGDVAIYDGIDNTGLSLIHI